jgi:predicted  nucleic acid-binding Zn-ribbon protein
MWRCGVCGYIHEGDEPPEQCPRCGAPREKFVQIEAEAVEKIERARFTNGLHMQLFSLLEDARDIADAGIEDDLDPGCVKIFTEVEAFAAEMQRKINAELEVHMKKGKWG